MKKENAIKIFGQQQVRTYWDEEKELWYISVIDVIEVLTDSIDPQAISAKFTLWVGSALGLLVFGIAKLLPQSAIGQVPFMLMAVYLFLICLAMQIALSFIYPVQHTANSKMLFWKSPLEPLKGASWRGLGNYKVLSVLLMIIMTLLFYTFR